MPKTKTNVSVHFSAESPVPGVGIELANLLVQAIKTRRKFTSRSALSSQLEDNNDAEKESLNENILQNLQNNADDKTTAFLNVLRRQVEHSSAYASKPSSRRNISKSNAPENCVKFLFEILSNGTNSFHLRRSGLALARETLVRSSDARAFMVNGRCLLDFVSMVEGTDHDREPQNSSNMCQASLFRLEAMELIHHLAAKFGNIYAQFTVASRLLGDISVSLSMPNNTANPTHANNNNDLQNEEGGRPSSQRMKMTILRRERDIALDYGLKACTILERMIERADKYFRVLVPRFGGFNGEPLNDLKKDGANNIEETAEINTITTSESKLVSQCNEINHDEDDDDSIDWEEGDFDLSMENTDDSTSSNPSLVNHQVAVAHTLDIMGRSGALLDGNLAVQISGGKSMEIEATSTECTTEIPTASPIAIEGATDANNKARIKLQHLVQKISSRLQRLNQWIHALSHADGMEERAVIDPATAGVPGMEGPVSIVLLSGKKRTMRGELLQRMMTLRGEIDSVLKSATVLGITPNGAENKKACNGITGTPFVDENVKAPESGTCTESTGGMKRPRVSASERAGVVSKKKKSKTSRFKVIYKN